MKITITEPSQTSIPSNAEAEGKTVVGMVSRGGEARRQKRRLKGRTAGPDSLGRVQKKENEEEMLDIQEREGSGVSKSDTPIEMEAAAIEPREKTG
jgi:hypothetical protein